MATAFVSVPAPGGLANLVTISPPASALAAPAVAPLKPGAARSIAGPVAALAVVAAVAVDRRHTRAGGRAVRRRYTNVDESEQPVAPWEEECETEKERNARYKREAEEMKLKWDSRRQEEK